MISKPRLKTYLTVFPLGDSTWGLRGGDEEMWRLKLRDPRHFEAVGRLLPHLDGASTRDEILGRLGDNGTDPQLLAGLLDQLDSAGFLEDAAAGRLDPDERRRHRDQLRFFSRFGGDGGEAAQAALAEARVAVAGDSPLAAAVGRVLVRSGFGEVSALAGEGAAEEGGTGVARLALDREAIWPDGAGEPPHALVVAQQAHDPQLLEAVDAFSKERRVPWLLVRLLDPHEGWVGPLFIPGETPSYVSFHARLQGHRKHPEAHRAFEDHLRRDGAAARPAGGLHPFAEQLAGMAAVELIKLITGFAIPHLAGRFVTVDLLTWETESHRVLKVPRLEAESYSRPRLFPWKEIPYGDKPTRRA